MEKKIKVGDSFDVVEALVSEFDIIRGKNYIVVGDSLLDDANELYYTCLIDRKLVGKLTVTKVK